MEAKASEIKVVIANDGKIIHPDDKSAREEVDNLIASFAQGSDQTFYNGRYYRRIDEKIPGIGLIVVFVDITSIKEEISKELKEEILKELKEEYGVDQTTGLSTKKVATDHILEYLKGIKENPEDFTLVMADIDYFKNINDTYGHHFGDIVLNIISQILKQGLRSSDIIGRYGGEEIFFIIKNALLKDAIAKLNQLLLKIQKTLIPCGESFIHSPTISFGAVHLTQNNVKSLEDDEDVLLGKLIIEADRALYISKNNGRDQYTINDFSGKEILTGLLLTRTPEGGRRSNDVQNV